MTNERPIIMTGESVRAILDGGKTQTRRVIKPQPRQRNPGEAHSVWWWNDRVGWAPDREPKLLRDHCPYGVPGDRLWVRETWRVSSEGNYTPDGKTGEKTLYVCYRANQGLRGRNRGAQHRTSFRIPDDDDLAMRAWGKNRSGSWRPSIHMPRWASRLTLEVTGVRVERLQDISEEDAAAEAAALCRIQDAPHDARGPVVDGFRAAWDRTNGKRPGYSWTGNPWVWVLEFRKTGDENTAIDQGNHGRKGT